MRRATGLFLLVAACPAQAQEEIVVTGASLPSPAGTAAYGSVTIDHETLAMEPSGRLENALRDITGFQLFRRTDARSANPTSQGASFRALGGNASSRALVLLDGVPQLDPFAGWVAWPTLDPDRLSAARITRGGGAGAFGAGALAGTIELFSAGPDIMPAADIGVDYGSRESWRASAGLASSLAGGFAALSGRFDRGDGYILLPLAQRGPVDVPARYRQWSLAARAVVPVGDANELQVRGNAFDDERRRGLVGAESSNDGADASVRLIGRGAWAWEALAYVQARSFASGFVSVSADRATVTPTLDQFDTPATGLGAKLELRPPLGDAHDVQLGIDARRNAGRTHEAFRFQSGRFTRLRDAGGETRVVGLYLEDGWRVSEGLSLTGGLRLDRWWIEDGFLKEREIGDGHIVADLAYPDRAGWEPTARIGALVRLTPALQARGASYLGFRLPTLNELYRPFRVGADATAANAALRPERLRGIEAGVDFAPLSTARAGLTLFWNEVEDAIANVTLGRGPGNFPQVGFVAAGGAFRQRLNIDAIRSRGVEAQAMLDYGAWGLRLSYAFADAAIRAHGPAAELDRQRPAQTPRHQASATLRRIVGGDFGAALTARYAGPQFEDDLGQRRLDAAFTLDASVELPLAQGAKLTFMAENLLDSTIQAGVSEAGVVDRGTPRTLWIGLRWTAR